MRLTFQVTRLLCWPKHLAKAVLCQLLASQEIISNWAHGHRLPRNPGGIQSWPRQNDSGRLWGDRGRGPGFLRARRR